VAYSVVLIVADFSLHRSSKLVGDTGMAQRKEEKEIAGDCLLTAEVVLSII
jgi:hypothetical protein